jgi:hypothetical protein
MDDFIYVLGAVMGCSPDEVDFGRRVVAELNAAEEMTVNDAGDHLVSLRLDSVDELVWLLMTVNVMSSAINHGHAVIETSAGFTTVENYGEGFKVVSIPLDEVPATL